MIDIVSGHAAIDRYLTDGFERVRGMSSKFAAGICGHLMRRQTELGIAGDLVEIGTYEGRFFIALTLGLQPGEHALGMDVFDWPDAGVQQRMVDNCAAHGLTPDRFTSWKASSRSLAPADLLQKLGAGRKARFIHVDSEHTPECLAHDLELAHAALHERGVIALDDMLHPSYPMLLTAVIDYLTRHPEMRVLCIIDRETISAAAKFLICRTDVVPLYEQDLMESFARFHFIVGSMMMGHLTLVLTPDPTLPKLD